MHAHYMQSAGRVINQFFPFPIPDTFGLQDCTRHLDITYSHCTKRAEVHTLDSPNGKVWLLVHDLSVDVKTET